MKELKNEIQKLVEYEALGDKESFTKQAKYVGQLMVSEIIKLGLQKLLNQNNMYTITKRFKNYPFAHRQHSHDGHCKLIHGHNWDFEICLESEELDENGFVYDFGKFGWLKEWLAERFDHTCVINQDDPELAVFKVLNGQGLLNLLIVDSCSSEGLAKLVFDKINTRIGHGDRVRLKYVRVYEDEKNTAIYTGGK